MIDRDGACSMCRVVIREILWQIVLDRAFYLVRMIQCSMFMLGLSLNNILTFSQKSYFTNWTDLKK